MSKHAKIALAIGGAVVIGFALWEAARALGVSPAMSVTPGNAGATPAPTEAAPTAARASARRAIVGTDSTGAPVHGTGTASADKSPSAVAQRALGTARGLFA